MIPCFRLLSLISAGLLALIPAARAVEIRLDYTYDTNGFFNQPGAKQALRSVADFYQKLLHDNLAAIDASTQTSASWTAKITHPGTGASQDIPNLKVPANTIIIYAGGRPMGGTGAPAGIGGPGGYSAGGFQPWFDLLKGRGQAGALASPATDFGPWGGSIMFDTQLTWNFSTTTPDDDLTAFISIALHEVGHLLGVGTAPSWTAKIAGSVFTGANSVGAYGSNVPLQAGGGHWRDDAACEFPDGYDPANPNNVLSKAFGSFGAPHGYAQISLMDPGLCAVGPYHKTMTNLDLAALRDIGWEMIPPSRWITANTRPASGPVLFTWPSTSNLTYRVERSTTLATGGWSTLSTQAGNGSIQTYTDPSPPPAKAFYRLTTTPPAAAIAARNVVTIPAASSLEPVSVPNCGLTTGCCR